MSIPVFYTPTYSISTYYFVVLEDFESNTPYLQYIPSKNVAYGVGGAFGALLLASLATAFMARAHVFLTGTLASACLMISFFLRATLAGESTTHNVSMYVAAYILDSCGAFLLTFMALLMASKWVAYLEDNRGATGTLLMALGGLYILGAVVLESIGIVFAFKESAWLRHVGHILHITTVAATLAISGIGLLVTIWKAVADTGREIIVEMINLAVPFTLLALWASFAMAQTKLPLSSSANTSEVTWYLLNPLPLGLVLLVWALFNAPRVFSYESYVAPKPQNDAYYGRYEHQHANDAYCQQQQHQHQHQTATGYAFRPQEPPFHQQTYQQAYQQPVQDNYYRYQDGRAMTDEDKIQKAMLRYA